MANVHRAIEKQIKEARSKCSCRIDEVKGKLELEVGSSEAWQQRREMEAGKKHANVKKV